MEILVKIGQFLLSLSILIILHEFGHFFFARLFKTRVEKFYLFFNPWFSLFKFKKGETEYGIGWIPLGGYVKISGMIDESMDVEQMKQPPQPYEFRSKPSWQRLLIMLGGVLVNFILALVIYIGVLYTWGEEYLPTSEVKYGIAVDSLGYQVGFRSGDKIISVDNKPVDNFFKIIPTIVLEEAKTVQVLRDTQVVNVELPDHITHALIRKKELFTVRIPFIVGGFTKESVAKQAGFQVGDKMLKINGQEAIYFDQFRSILSQHKNDTILVTVERSGQHLDIKVKVPETGLLGIYPDGNLSKFFIFKHIEYGFFESIPAGISKGFNTLGSYIKQFKLVFSPTAKGYESLGGFITMGSIFPGTWDWQAFWSLTAFLSIILAFMNILPIPALDGGHIMFLLYEMITGRKPSDKFLERAQMIGLAILFALLIYANLNDVIRLFSK
ncbi:MAG: RIP metalloprotease RseP [Bacteroidales bacterium]|nr:RIP metalloprotease RseP [Bacteroidales bacterium]